MRFRTALAAVAATAALALPLAACAGGGQQDTSLGKPAGGPLLPSGAASQIQSSIEALAGLPPEPVGEARRRLLAALKAVDSGLVADEAAAVEASRYQCAALAAGATADAADAAAAERFSHGGHTVDAATGARIDAVLRQRLCPGT